MRRKTILENRSHRSEIAGPASSTFVPREIFFRFDDRFRHFPISVRLQKASVAVSTLLLVWVLYSSGSYLAHRNMLAARNEQIGAQGREISNLQARLGETTRNRHRLKVTVVALNEALAQAADRTDQVTKQRTSLEQRVDALKRRIVALHNAEMSVIERLSERTSLGIEQMEQSVEMVGLDVSTLITGVNGALGSQGGPFVAEDARVAEFEPGVQLEVSVSSLDEQLNRYTALQELLRILPLSAPLEQFRISSSYGARVDPVNQRKAWHYGVDLAAPMGTPIYATAPGKVVFAGRRGGFGRMVEVDHGYGIHTRYAHLRKIFVIKGQEIENRKKIGLVGASGRSTGPHVHYEVRYKGHAKNPIKFIRAGAYIFKG